MGSMRGGETSRVPRCRFYSREFPNVGETVVGIVESVDEDRGFFVSLPEYVGAEGLVALEEVSRRPLLRTRPLRQVVKVGRREVLRVLRVDAERGYVDLSKRRVNMSEMEACLERFTHAKVVNAIIKNTARRLGRTKDEEVEDLCSRTAWQFSQSYESDSAAYCAFVTAISRPEVLDKCDVDGHEREALEHELRCRLTPQVLRFRSEFNACCFGSEGIEALRRSFLGALERTSEKHQLRIRLLAPPRYLLTLDTADVLNRESCQRLMEETLRAVEEALVREGGEFRLVTQPQLTTDRDDRELRSLLSKFELANREMSGDEEDGDADEREPVQLSDPQSNDFWTLYTSRDKDDC